jgi:hypothetical protein
VTGEVDAQEAKAFIESSGFVWHQRFELAPGVWTPGVSSVPWLASAAGLPADLSGATVLDVGTTNAGTAFELRGEGPPGSSRLTSSIRTGLG